MGTEGKGEGGGEAIGGGDVYGHFPRHMLDPRSLPREVERVEPVRKGPGTITGSTQTKASGETIRKGDRLTRHGARQGLIKWVEAKKIRKGKTKH